jgi:predicted RNase H-like HicB family nuclease
VADEASIRRLTVCVALSQAEIFDEALSNLREGLELYFEEQPFPEGIEPPIIAPVTIPA